MKRANLHLGHCFISPLIIGSAGEPEYGSYTLLVKTNCHQASCEPLSRSYTYARALILADTVLVRAEANDLHQKRVRARISEKRHLMLSSSSGDRIEEENTHRGKEQADAEDPAREGCPR